MYTIIVKFTNNSFCKYNHVGSIKSFRTFIDTKEWVYYTIYNKKTRVKIDFIKNPKLNFK